MTSHNHIPKVVWWNCRVCTSPSTNRNEQLVWPAVKQQCLITELLCCTATMLEHKVVLKDKRRLWLKVDFQLCKCSMWAVALFVGRGNAVNWLPTPKAGWDKVEGGAAACHQTCWWLPPLDLTWWCSAFLWILVQVMDYWIHGGGYAWVYLLV